VFEPELAAALEPDEEDEPLVMLAGDVEELWFVCGLS